MRIVISYLTFLIISVSCSNHRDLQIEYSIRNGCREDIQWNSFNLNSDGFAGTVIISPNQADFTGGGGILDVDSVLFIRISNNDSLIYRNARHGDNILDPNHFFNSNNWKEEDTNKFYYTLTEEDFNN